MLPAGQSLVITGDNGSGKTTLVRLLCNLLTPTAGTISYRNGKGALEGEDLRGRIGLVGPYLQLYRDLSAIENLAFLARGRGEKPDAQKIRELLEKVGLKGRGKDPLKTYSSGMLQRAKYAAAILHNPDLLILDEPTANLDEAGKEMVLAVVNEQRKKGSLVVATNEAEERTWGEQHVVLA
ncbi:MAG: ABC transporter ATP-binding protein [Calditrichaeota bacterium]|nr:ABC transporter ATP-binding protein [Calditrichota bacterium]